MYILPYIKIHKQESNIYTFYSTFVFLTDNGTRVWKTDEEKPKLNYVIKEYLEPNGFHGKVSLKGDTILCEMDSIDVNTFYVFPDKAEEFWRPFYMVPGAGWEEEANKESLGTFGSVKRIWELVL
jgi:hypothetical protein